MRLPMEHSLSDRNYDTSATYNDRTDDFAADDFAADDFTADNQPNPAAGYQR